MKNRVANWQRTVARYLGQLVRIADLPGWLALRSARTSHLVQGTSRQADYHNGIRAFPVSGSRTWNQFPEYTASAQNPNHKSWSYANVFFISEFIPHLHTYYSSSNLRK